MNNNRLNIGDTVKHFKREVWLAKYEALLDSSSTCYSPAKYAAKISGDTTYLYKILNIATHTETKEKLVIYKALYTNEEMGVHINDVFARPYDMFMSEVDHTKYPDIKQKYRFEPV